MGSSKIITTSKKVNELVNMFDLSIPKMYNILVDDYELDNGCIKIKSAKLLDDNMKFIRFVDLSKIIDHLTDCNVIFDNDRATDPSKTNQET